MKKSLKRAAQSFLGAVMLLYATGCGPSSTTDDSSSTDAKPADKTAIASSLTLPSEPLDLGDESNTKLLYTSLTQDGFWDQSGKYLASFSLQEGITNFHSSLVKTEEGAQYLRTVVRVGNTSPIEFYDGLHIDARTQIPSFPALDGKLDMVYTNAPNPEMPNSYVGNLCPGAAQNPSFTKLYSQALVQMLGGVLSGKTDLQDTIHTIQLNQSQKQKSL